MLLLIEEFKAKGTSSNRGLYVGLMLVNFYVGLMSVIKEGQSSSWSERVSLLELLI